MRDVTLYEDSNRTLCELTSPPPGAIAEGWMPVPAVVGITVAEVEALEQTYRDDRLAALRMKGERDEARAGAEKPCGQCGRANDEYEMVESDLLLARREAARYREALDDAIELAASAVRAHTRAIHHLAGNCDYPAAEQGATGERLADALRGCRDTRDALGGGDA